MGLNVKPNDSVIDEWYGRGIVTDVVGDTITASFGARGEQRFTTAGYCKKRGKVTLSQYETLKYPLTGNNDVDLKMRVALDDMYAIFKRIAG